LFDGLKAFKVGDIVGGDVTVSSLPPDHIDISGGQDPTQLNLFLLQTTFNQGWRNVGLPTRNSNGDRIDDNPLALNLHYLLTAYGNRDYYAEIILGHAMQLLHESPVLTRAAIRAALSPASPPPHWPAALATSELADQIEQLKITPEVFNTEEISKLWSAINVHYRPTAAYQVTVVLIESNRPRKSALPVTGRNIYVVPFNQPEIESVDNADITLANPTLPINALSTLLVKGSQLRGDVTQVMVGGFDLTANVTELRQTEIKLPLPGPLPAGMRAGIQTIQVVQTRNMGTPEVPHAGVESNVEAFVLRPIITTNAPTGITNAVVDGVNVRSGKVKINFNPKVGKTQKVMLLLNQLNPPPNTKVLSYTFKAPAGNGVVDPNTETTQVEFTFTNVVPGSYLVRVQVDGAESSLVIDGTGKYATPKVTI
jgi:hypothetical protein